MTANGFNTESDLWITIRSATDYKHGDPSLIKMNRAHLFIEKPAMKVKIKDLTGKKVLSVGCGSGEECNLLQKKGASDITGIDIASKLIKEARRCYPKYKFHTMNVKNMKFEDNTFDFVYSSLMMHYLKDWKIALAEINRVMKSGSTFLFSTLHPTRWSGERQGDTLLMGFQYPSNENKLKIFGDYLNKKAINDVGIKQINMTSYVRPLSDMFRELVKANFEIIDIYEPKATTETKFYDLGYHEINQKIPDFIIFEAKKK
jgi:ubiquinone/menaquinone biosynthesis C-methylase UbiE